MSHLIFATNGFLCFFCYFMHSFGTLALSLLFSMWFDLLKFDIDVVLQSELCRYVDTNTHTYSFTPEWNFKIERNLLFYSLKWMHNGTKMDAQRQRWADNLWWNEHGYGFPIHFQFTTIFIELMPIDININKRHKWIWMELNWMRLGNLGCVRIFVTFNASKRMNVATVE